MLITLLTHVKNDLPAGTTCIGVQGLHFTERMASMVSWGRRTSTITGTTHHPCAHVGQKQTWLNHDIFSKRSLLIPRLPFRVAFFKSTILNPKPAIAFVLHFFSDWRFGRLDRWSQAWKNWGNLITVNILVLGRWSITISRNKRKANILAILRWRRSSRHETTAAGPTKLPSSRRWHGQ